MGIYDRDYERHGGFGQPPGLRLDGPRTLTTNLVLLTLGVYLLQIFTQAGPRDYGWLTNLGSLYADVFQRPWRLFEFLTYGFLHDPGDLRHIIFNMIGLWFFGRAVEQRYGRSEYLAFYLAAIVFAGLVWCVAQWGMVGMQSRAGMLGASGGLSAILILFALNYPKQMIYIWGILPVPAWAFALFFVGSDVMGALNRSGDVAYTAHLGGALFGFLYYRFGWRVSNWLPGSFFAPQGRGAIQAADSRSRRQALRRQGLQDRPTRRRHPQKNPRARPRKPHLARTPRPRKSESGIPEEKAVKRH